MATPHLTTLRGLPRALDDDGLLIRLAGRRPAVFLDYDGVLTPIVDHPADARISDDVRDTVRSLARRCPVCVRTRLTRRGGDLLIVDRATAADLVLDSPIEVQRFLARLAR